MKHAYLIIAHNNFYILEKQLKMLDDSRNDIFIHIDKKVKNFDFMYFSSLAKYSNVIFASNRIDVRWGTSRQIKTEIKLFETAYKYNPDGYAYYHLISGVDLPIKSQDYIHKFFENKTENYIFYKQNISCFDKRRISLYRMCIANKTILNKMDFIQMKLHIDRIKNCKYEFQKGYNWGSFTNDAVRTILNAKEDIYKFTFCSLCADEVYKQMVLHHYNAKIYKDANGQTCDMRLVDWNRGNSNHPYVYKIEDFDEIIKSDMLFARKFDENTDKKIIDKVYEYVTESVRRNI